MCGIAGILDVHEGQVEAAQVSAMLRSLVHRGPDDEGCVEFGNAALGMRRLSILDPTPRGHQPMTTPDRRYTAIHNGEIYNFLELADELAALGHVFRTGTDTEVLLAAFAEWGPRCVERFNGIWACAIWDDVEKRLFLSRDRFGVKPLYVAEKAGKLAFASEIKALLALPWVSREPRLAVIRSFLLTGDVDRGSETFYRAVRRFPAGTTLTRGLDYSSTTRYWSPPALSADSSFMPAHGDEERVEAFRDLLVDAVTLQLRSDVPIGTCLSGGVDSSSIVCIAGSIRREGSRNVRANRQANPHLAFFADFQDPEISERIYVDAVVRETGLELRTTSPTEQDFLATLEDVLAAQDEPFGSLSIVAQYHVMKLAHRAGIKVLLDGQGADELLGGYRHYAAIRLAGAIRSRGPEDIRHALRLVRSFGLSSETARYALLGSKRIPDAVRRKEPYGWVRIDDRTNATWTIGSPQSTMLSQVLLNDTLDRNLPALLRYEDRNSMAFGIEARVPFLDHRVAEAALALPDRLRVPVVRPPKDILRRAMRAVVPSIVLDRTDKIAFEPPEVQWLGSSMDYWVGLSRSSVAESEGLLTRGALNDALDSFQRGRLTSTILWRLLNTELWLRSI